MGLDEIATFVEVVEQGSLAGAARALGVPKSTVSRRLTRLEAELGEQLVQRHSRLFRVTEAGDHLYRGSVGAVRDLHEAARAVQEGAGGMRGELRITAPQDLGASIAFAELVVDFRAAYPEVELRVDITDRTVDLVAEGYDFALRAHPGRLPDSAALKMRRLGTVTIGIYGAPSYLDRQGRPQEPADLAQHLFVLPEQMGVELAVLRRRDAPEVVEPLVLRSPIRTTSMSFLPAAAVAGAGLAVVLDHNARPLVDRGQLERVLPDWQFPSGSLSLLWPASRLPNPRRRAFLDFIPGRLLAEEPR